MVLQEYKTYYDFMVEVVHEAGQLVIDGFNNRKPGESKQHGELIETEKSVEELLTRKIQNRFPEHLVIGERSTGRLTDAHTWIINPIDGKQNFLNGTPIVAISVALAIEKNAVLGIVFNPIMNQFYSTIKSGGAYCNGQIIASSKNKDLNESVVGIELSFPTNPSLQGQALNKVRKLSEHKVLGFRCFGSNALSLCYLASGNLDVYLNDAVHSSAVAAGMLILQEAGGSVYCPYGNNIELPSGMLFSAGSNKLLQKIMEILK